MHPIAIQVISVLVSSFLMAGCATTATPTAAPIPTDLGGWTTVQVEAPPASEPTVVYQITPPPRERPAAPSERVYPYEDGHEYSMDVAVGYTTDIRLQVGETIQDKGLGDRGVLPAGDEQPPWDIKEGSSGTPARPHVFVTVTKPGLRTGLVITTNKRIYLVQLRSVGASKARILRWTYADDLAADTPMEAAARTSKAPRLLPDPREPQGYHVGYAIEPSSPRPPWMPRQVLDDGRKTYILFPTNLAVMAAPMIRLQGPQGYELVNARQVGSVMVLDHIISHAAELRIGKEETAETVRIVRQASRTIYCPGSDTECPQWPTNDMAQLGR